MLTGTSSRRRPASTTRIRPSTSGAPLVYGTREERERLGVDGVEAARRVAERSPQDDANRAAQQTGAEAPRPSRAVPVRRVAVSRHEAGAHRNIALAAPHALEEPRELVRRVLAVGVDASAERIAVLERPAVTGGDPDPETLVRTE